jgi:hypothetical protein
MHRNEIAALRTQLRNVNIEYSALVRNSGEGTPSQLDELKVRRRALMARIAEAALPARPRIFSVPSAAVEHAA